MGSTSQATGPAAGFNNGQRCGYTASLSVQLFCPGLLAFDENYVHLVGHPTSLGAHLLKVKDQLEKQYLFYRLRW
jgi:hypothetical protein